MTEPTYTLFGNLSSAAARVELCNRPRLFQTSLDGLWDDIIEMYGRSRWNLAGEVAEHWKTHIA